MSTETIRLITILGTGRRGGRGYGGGGRGRVYTYHYTVTTRMTSVLRWAVMRAILMFQKKVMTKSQDSVHKPQPFWRERRAEPVSNRGPSAYQPNALPLGLTGSHSQFQWSLSICSAVKSSSGCPLNISLILNIQVDIYSWANSQSHHQTIQISQLDVCCCFLDLMSLRLLSVC